MKRLKGSTYIVSRKSISRVKYVEVRNNLPRVRAVPNCATTFRDE